MMLLATHAAIDIQVTQYQTCMIVPVCSSRGTAHARQIQFTQNGICLANKLFPQFATNILSEFLTPL